MHSPYTPQPFDALVIAQTSVGLALTAVIWSRPSRPAASSWILAIAVWWAVLLPMQDQLLEAFGVHPSPGSYHSSLSAIAMLATIAALLSGRPGTIAFAVVAQIGLAKVTGLVVASDWELAALHLAYLGALVGLQARSRDQDIVGGTLAPSSASRSFLAHDLALFALATSLAVAVSIFLLDQSIDSSDEWAYTFQAAVFAKGHAYAPAPPCSPAFQNFWVFDWSGRQFSQYTPGWPLFMTPFFVFGVPQFAAAASLGLLVVGVAGLARRAARECGQVPRAIAAAGTIAALCCILSSTLLVNGGSRFAHVFAAALLAWGVEAMCATVEVSRSGTPRAQLAWSFGLGACAALLWATRPGDGTISALGLGLFGFYALLRRELSWRAVAGTAAGGLLFCGITLVILRLQLGAWFKTGYALTPIVHPWNKIELGWPEPSEWRYGIPLATGSYCWWPLAPALGIAGLVTLRGRAARITFMLGLGAMGLLGLSALLVLGRGFDWGYGPRYVLPLVVPMGVGTGVALAPLWVRAHRSSGRMAAGPWTLAVLAIVVGVVRLVPLVYPGNTAAVRTLNALNAGIREKGLHHAVVLVPPNVGWKNDGLDLTMNLPLSLYRKQDVIIAMSKTPELTKCMRESYADRTFYTAIPGEPITFKKE